MRECWSDLRADTRTLFFPDKNVTEQHSLSPSQPWCKVQESIEGLGDKHSEFEMKQENVTDTPQCVISTMDHRNTGKGKSKNTGKGNGNHVGRCGNESAF